MQKVVVSKELLSRVAKNARISLTEKEIETILPQFREMLSTFQKISRVDTKGFEPAFHPVQVKNVWRDDKVGDCLSQEQALSNARHKKNGFFKGPKVVQ